MTSRPPDAGSSKDEPTVAEPPPEQDEGSPTSAARRIAVVGGLVVAVVVVAVLVMDSSDRKPAPAVEAGPEQGVVCPFLREAFDEFEGGNETAFAETVRVAARESELTLERSGQVFGDPEDLALRLGVAVDDGANRSRVLSLLAEGESACKQLGLWDES